MKKLPIVLIILAIVMVIGTVVYKKTSGTMKDPRDGKTYRTVKIGDQVWMAENLDFDYNVGSARSYCYEDKPENCQKYGRLYTWAAAMDSAALFSKDGFGCGKGKTCTAPDDVRGICPEGWALPTIEDWTGLFITLGGQGTAGQKLKSSQGWEDNGNGTDEYSFTAIPAGNEDCSGTSQYFNVGDHTFFWSSTESNDILAFQMHLDSDYKNSWLEDRFSKSCGYSVRCIKKKSSPRPRVTSASAIDSITDYRDGKIYMTVKIGNQTWMAENLNYDYNVGSAKSYCYNNEQSDCEDYGRLYTWAAAIDSAGIFSKTAEGCGIGSDHCWMAPPVQGVCPEGWHVPTNAELTILVSEASKAPANFKSLFAPSGWERNGHGTDDFSFSLYPAGLKSYQTGTFLHQGDCAYLWSGDSHNGWSTKDYNATYFWFTHDTQPFPNIDKRDALSIRCIKD
jgi:uncharacterized protein (TIGR02145 family)